MIDDGSTSPDSKHRVVVNFRRGPSGVRRPPAVPPPVNDLANYSRSSERDDYRHRMLVNAAALLFLIALIGAGLWIADSMASLRRNQDCALSGRRNCVPIDVNKDRF